MSEPTPDPELFDKIVNLSKRRGIVFQSAEIYGGFRSDIRLRARGRAVAAQREGPVVAVDGADAPRRRRLDAAILSPPQVWEASGHLGELQRSPGRLHATATSRFRARQARRPVQRVPRTAVPSDEFTEPRAFNLMFKTHAGPVEGAGHEVYLRPETAQGMFVNFMNVLNTSRKKPPFGIAQIGKSFRNEITPGNFVFRTREFEQMEMEYFVPPTESAQWYEYWKPGAHAVVPRSRHARSGLELRMREHDADELSALQLGHRRRRVPVPVGLGRARGHRQPGRLRPHPARPAQRRAHRVLRPSRLNEQWMPARHRAGGRAPRVLAFAFLLAAYDEETVNDETRTVLRLDPRLAPYKVAVLPLSKKDTLTPTAHEVFDLVKGNWMTDYDETQSIGKRYARADEIGTPYCVTVDFDTLEDRAVTVRERDSREQDRVSIDRLVEYLSERLPS